MDGGTAAWHTTRWMAGMFVVLALAVLFWHVAGYWAVHPEMTWGRVLQDQRRRAIGGAGLFLWGAALWLVSSLRLRHGLHRKRHTYTLRRRGRRL